MATKKYLTSIARQKIIDTPDAGFPYQPVGSEELMYEPTSFPILALMNASLNEGDRASLISLRLNPVNSSDLSEINFNKLSEEAERLCKSKGTTLNIVDFRVSNDETINAQLNLFSRLISEFENGDNVFADLTYGTKPQMLSQLFALNYISEALKDASVGRVVYGSLDFTVVPGTNRKRIYDITPLFMMNRIVNRLGEFGHPDPANAVKKILDCSFGETKMGKDDE